MINLVCLKNNERGGERIPFLLNNFDLINHMIEFPDKFFEKINEIGIRCNIDYAKIEERITLQKIKCYDWLTKSLKDKKLSVANIQGINSQIFSPSISI